MSDLRPRLKNIFYRVLSLDPDEEYEIEMNHESIWRSPTYAAELAAEDFHQQHGGWECTWPLTFSLHDTKGGPAVAVCEVNRESVPTFTAKEIQHAK